MIQSIPTTLRPDFSIEVPRVITECIVWRSSGSATGLLVMWLIATPESNRDTAERREAAATSSK
jgi:hypothetical protein